MAAISEDTQPSGTTPEATLDRVTDLFEKWAAEESEHRQAGEYGLAEGLAISINDLRNAIHGGTP